MLRGGERTGQISISKLLSSLMPNKKGLSSHISCQTLSLLVPGTRLELVQGHAPRDFKSENDFLGNVMITAKYIVSLLFLLLNKLGNVRVF